MDLIVLRGVFKVWDMSYNPILNYTSPQLCLWSVWRAPCCLLSGTADSEAFQIRCIYTAIMWQIKWYFDCTQVDPYQLIMWLLKLIGWVGKNLFIYMNNYFFHSSTIWTILPGPLCKIHIKIHFMAHINSLFLSSDSSLCLWLWGD